jgi:probable phosphoglycerate mutase
MTSESNETWVTYSDGASRGNPGPASYGAVVIDPSGTVLQEISVPLGVTTNNIAEYKGLIAALESALELGAERVEARLDSELLVRQAMGRYKVKHPGLIPLHRQVIDLARRFSAIEFKHVRREFNKHADALANQALDRGPS